MSAETSNVRTRPNHGPRLDRRQLLIAGAGVSALACLPSARAPNRAQIRTDDRVLVVLQLYGGNDGFNTLVRFEDDAYHRARPRLAFSKSATLPIDDQHGLHPALVRTKEWWDRGNVAIVDGVGSDRTSLSHFRSDAVWEAGGEERAHRAGWLGRLMDQRIERGLDAASPVAMMALGRDVLPHSLRSTRITAPAIPDLAAFVRERAPNALDTVGIDPVPIEPGSNESDRRLAECQATVQAALTARERLARAAREPALVDHPGTEIGRTLEGVAKVLRARLGTRVVYATMASFDTHTTQSDDHARLLHELDEALNALLWDLHAQSALERTLIVTISEFGRRLVENGIGVEAGTDHGRSSMLFALGGGVRPGIHGIAPSFEDLDGDGNVRATVDFRRVYATLVERWLGSDSEEVLGGKFDPLDFVRES
jgi:uncharacterized protein (DUF1501 family)